MNGITRRNLTAPRYLPTLSTLDHHDPHHPLTRAIVVAAVAVLVLGALVGRGGL